MNIKIEGKSAELISGKGLYSYISELGLDSDDLRLKPLAAMLGGEIFNLSFVPKRECEFRLIRYSDDEGRRVYERTLRFVLILAVRRLLPSARVIVQYSMGQGVFITISKEGDGQLTDEDVSMLKKEMEFITSSAFKLYRSRRSINEAVERFSSDGQLDKVKLLSWRNFSYFDLYSCPDYSDYVDYFYGEMTLDTSYVSIFDLHRIDDSVVLLLPDVDDCSRAAAFEDSPKLLAVFGQSDRWGRLMGCARAAELNERVADGSIRELIRVNEALHEKVFSRTADEVISCGAKAVMIAGPSSSGKTTSANRIATQLRASGLDPIMLSLDDYYIDRDLIERDENGEIDLEHINTIDTARFSRDLSLLIDGEEVSLPRFNFLTGKREEGFRTLKLHSDQPLIIEGLHALNPLLLGDIPHDRIYRVYVSALTTLNLDDHNRIRTADLRLLRRLVRDYRTRGASMEQTLSMWASVRRGESRWIFPFQENADCIINTTLHYEAAVLKKYVHPLLQEVPIESPYYTQARSIVKYLNYFVSADVEDEIPPTSILREFIGGNTFYR